MQKFKFRLASLENLKGMELDTLKQRLSLAQAELRKAERELITTRDTLNETYNEIAELREQQTDPMILMSLESYTQYLRTQLAANLERVNTLNKETRQARSALQEKHKEKKVLEKYREHQQEAHANQVKRLEQEEIDETASQRSGSAQA